jgi:hypothetical protein
VSVKVGNRRNSFVKNVNNCPGIFPKITQNGYKFPKLL